MIIQNVKKYDSRLQTLDEEPNRILTVESKYLIVDSFVKYRITNVRTFYDATSGSFINLNNLLGQRTAFELKNQFGRRTVTELVSGERDQLMRLEETHRHCGILQGIGDVNQSVGSDSLRSQHTATVNI